MKNTVVTKLPAGEIIKSKKFIDGTYEIKCIKTVTEVVLSVNRSSCNEYNEDE